MKRINVEIEEELHAKLKILAIKRKMPLKHLIPELLEMSLEASLEVMSKNEEGKNEGGGKNVENEEEGKKDESESTTK